MIIEYLSKENWLAERSKGIGGSDASAVIGRNPYKTNIELWEEKVGLRKPKDISMKSYVIYGLKSESLLVQLFALDYPQYLVNYNDKFRVHYNDKYPFIFCTRDCDLIEIETGKKGALEVKTTEILNSMHKEKWNEQVPENYYIQILQYFATDNDLEFVWLKAQIKSNFGGGDLRIATKHYYFTREQCQEDIDFLIKNEVRFWEKYVITKQKPSLILPPI